MLLPLEQVVPFGVLEHLRAKARDCTMLTRRPEQLGSRRRPRSVSLCLSEWASFFTTAIVAVQELAAQPCTRIHLLSRWLSKALVSNSVMFARRFSYKM